jgi:hypothetical protein
MLERPSPSPDVPQEKEEDLSPPEEDEMIRIEPLRDGRLHIETRHRSADARDEAEAWDLLFEWGHTDVSIKVALAQLKKDLSSLPGHVDESPPAEVSPEATAVRKESTSPVPPGQKPSGRGRS